MTWLINPGADATTQRLGGGDTSTWSAHQNALAQAQATGRPLADVMQEVQQFVQGPSSSARTPPASTCCNCNAPAWTPPTCPSSTPTAWPSSPAPLAPAAARNWGSLSGGDRRNLAGAHEASADVLATEAVYNWLTPQVGPQLQREAARFANVPRATGTLAELNRRNLPGTLADLVRASRQLPL